MCQANLSTCMYPPPHMAYMYPPPHTIFVKRTCLLVCILLLIWHTRILLLIPYVSSELVYLLAFLFAYGAEPCEGFSHSLFKTITFTLSNHQRGLHMRRGHESGSHVLIRMPPPTLVASYSMCTQGTGFRELSTHSQKKKRELSTHKKKRTEHAFLYLGHTYRTLTLYRTYILNSSTILSLYRTYILNSSTLWLFIGYI